MPAYYDLPAIKLIQDEHVVYLTSVSPALLRSWRRHGVLIVEQFKENQFGDLGGYQRGLSEQRAREIARFVRGQFPTRRVILPMLPQTVLLNARAQSGRPLFTPRRKGAREGTIRIFDRSRLAQVDGQHRIEGVVRASQDEEPGWSFELPVAIVDGLSLAREAAQFLTINIEADQGQDGLGAQGHSIAEPVRGESPRQRSGIRGMATPGAPDCHRTR